jgi:hypothetical protein
MRPVYIHAGAHRTGTSSFQLCLAENRAILEGAGYCLAYPGRDGAPDGTLRLKLPRPWQKPGNEQTFVPGARAHVAKVSGGSGALILSEENITGSMRHLFEGRFFPANAMRCRVLKDALGAPKHLVFVVRPYAQFLRSAYRKLAENNAVPDFDQVVPAFCQMDRGWPEIVTEMRNIFEPERLSVISYARRGTSVGLLRFLVPQAPDGLIEPERTVNLSATDAALQALQQHHRSGERLKRPEWRSVIRSHAKNTAALGFADWPEDAEKHLNSKWKEDESRLLQMSGIEMLA